MDRDSNDMLQMAGASDTLVWTRTLPVAPTGQSPRIIRFGAFEIDLDAAELRKQGLRLRLQEQPFQILAALLENPGQVVTREALIRRLWADGTVVDFDRGLNAAVTRLRQVLADSAETPRYVETVARRGYRFVAAIDGPVEPALFPTVPLTPTARRPVALRWLWAAAIAMALAAGLIWLTLSRGTAHDEPLTVTPFITDPGIKTDATISPEGAMVAYSATDPATGNADIWVRQIGSDSSLRLTTNPSPDFAPAWSPDGRRIAFLRSAQTHVAEIILAPPLGGPERTVGSTSCYTDRIVYMENSGVSPPYLAWTPDSRWLVTADRISQDGACGLVLLSVETGKKRSLASRN